MIKVHCVRRKPISAISTWLIFQFVYELLNLCHILGIILLYSRYVSFLIHRVPRLIVVPFTLFADWLTFCSFEGEINFLFFESASRAPLHKILTLKES